MAKPFFIRCFVKQASDVWVAASVDLGLAAQGETCEEAKAKLDEQIQDYVTQAVTVDREHMYDLLTRKAPASVQMEYYFILLMTKFGLASDERPDHNPCHQQGVKRGASKRAGLFEELIPALPA